MTSVRFIGDIHGEFNEYSQTIKNIDTSIQVGDFGVGFGHEGQAKVIDEFLDSIPGNHRFIRGNHDSPSECKKSKHWIPDVTKKGEVMFIGGARSIDAHWRTPGVSWWEDEELSMQDLYLASEMYRDWKPRVLVTHECPESVATNMMIPLVKGHSNFRSRTRDALEHMYESHQPEIHIFGHWHHRVDTENFTLYKPMGDDVKTRFICIEELGYIDLEVDLG